MKLVILVRPSLHEDFHRVPAFIGDTWGVRTAFSRPMDTSNCLSYPGLVGSSRCLIDVDATCDHYPARRPYLLQNRNAPVRACSGADLTGEDAA